MGRFLERFSNRHEIPENCIGRGGFSGLGGFCIILEKFDTFFGNFNKTFSKLYIPNVNHRLLYHINLLEPFLKMNIHRFFFSKIVEQYFSQGGLYVKQPENTLSKWAVLILNWAGGGFLGGFFLGGFWPPAVPPP